jgi:hypothetical protein
MKNVFGCGRKQLLLVLRHSTNIDLERQRKQEGTPSGQRPSFGICGIRVEYL